MTTVLPIHLIDISSKITLCAAISRPFSIISIIIHGFCFSKTSDLAHFICWDERQLFSRILNYIPIWIGRHL